MENGKRIADETAQSLEVVINDIQEASSMMDTIAKASADQAESISQITLGIDQISSVVQTNSATAEESAAASQVRTGSDPERTGEKVPSGRRRRASRIQSGSRYLFLRPGV